MIEPMSLLDTDILSLLMHKNAAVSYRAEQYLSLHSELTFSIITRFEILRGLKVKKASSQLSAFDVFCNENEIFSLTDSIIVRAADIYADLSSRGQLISDADILIAATAIEHGLILVTNNLSHFNRITGLQIDNWLL
jgi:tRNA(fMet)-specific endonuclease VapC